MEISSKSGSQKAPELPLDLTLVIAIRVVDCIWYLVPTCIILCVVAWQPIPGELMYFLTGRICVPIDIQNVDSFDPFSVPTVRLVGYQVTYYQS